MAYKMYIDGVVMPITPSKVKADINNRNETVNLIDGSEILILKSPGLTDISFELTFPAVNYPFANGKVQKPSYYLSLLEKLKSKRRSFQWILSRYMPNGEGIYHTNLTVGLESCQIVDDAKDGFDTTVSVKLKQYRSYGTKTVKIELDASETTEVTIEADTRETQNAPAEKYVTVMSGEALWNVAKKYTGRGDKYSEVYRLNSDKISDPNNVSGGTLLVMPTVTFLGDTPVR